MVGYTVTESPWDDQARAEAEALIEAESLVCPQCGNLREDCGDPDAQWYPQRHICYADRARLGAETKFRLKNSETPFQSWDGRAKSKKPSDKMPFEYHDGVRLWVSPHDLSPDDHFI